MKHFASRVVLFGLSLSLPVMAEDLTAEDIAAAEAEYAAQLEQQQLQELENQEFMRQLEAKMQAMEEEAAAEVDAPAQ